MKAININLKELLGAKEYNRFAQTALFPAIRHLADQGKLSNYDLARLAEYSKKSGAGIFAVNATDTGDVTRHSLAVGSPLITSMRLTDDLEIKLFVKKFRDKKSYQREASIQEKLTQHLRNTPLHGIVPNQFYRNQSRRMVVMHFVDGETLSKRLSKSITEHSKIELLRKTLDTYVTFAEEIENSKLFTQRKKKWNEDDYLPCLQNFDEFFERNFDADTELYEEYGKHIASRLNGHTTDFIHGDLHSRQVIVDDKIHLVDWESAMHGFMEFDLSKLLTKNGVSDKLQDSLLEYAVTRKEELRTARHKRSLNPGELADKITQSKIRYRFNQITQDLIIADRYSRHAKENKENSRRLEELAITSYNIALRNIEKSEREGMLDSRFREKLESCVKHKTYRRLDDEEFNKLLQEYNPHITVWQENLVSEDKIPSKIDDQLKEKYLKAIRNNLHKRDWGRLAKMGAAACLFLALSGFYGFKHRESERAREDTERKHQNELINDAYKNEFRSAYSSLVDDQMQPGLTYRELGVELMPFNRIALNIATDRKIVEDVCRKHNLPFTLIKTMYQVNSAVSRTWYDSPDRHGLNLLDPYRAHITGAIDPLDNLKYGARRLDILFSKYQVDRDALREMLKSDSLHSLDEYPTGVKEALIQFYSHEKNKNEADEEKQYALRSEFKNPHGVRKFPETVREIVYTLLKGNPMGTSTFLQLEKPPKEFMPE